MARKKRKTKPEAAAWHEKPWAWALAIGLATFALYLPTLWSKFVYDAEAQILIDGYIHDHSHFWEVMTFQVLGRDVLDFNRPVQLFFLMTDSLVWGKNPFGYHLTSNLMHAVNAGLLFLILTRLEAGRWAAALAALIFAAHPVLVEPVAEVSSREDVVATLFVLLSLWGATCFARQATWWNAAGTVVAAVLACGAKETGIVAPLLVGLYWLLYHRTEPPKRWAALLTACFLGVGIFFAARFGLQVKDSQVFLHPPPPLADSRWDILQIETRIWVFLIRNIFWPVHLSADYTGPDVLWITVWPALGVLAAVVAGQALLGWKSRIGLMGAAAFWLGLAPVSNFLPMYRPVADRFLYLPMAGVAMMACAALMLAKSRALNVMAAVAIAGLAVLTWQRQAVFANPMNLWRDTAFKSPASSTAVNNLGYALLDQKNYAGAEKAFARALYLDPKKADAMAGKAIALEYLGRPQEAEERLSEAIAIEPRYGEPDRLVTAMLATPENAAILEKIRGRKP